MAEPATEVTTGSGEAKPAVEAIVDRSHQPRGKYDSSA
jgi:hypothetical protein